MKPRPLRESEPNIADNCREDKDSPEVYGDQLLDESETEGPGLLKEEVEESPDEASLEEVTEMIAKEIPEGPDKVTRAKIIGAAAYKTIASIVGVKAITDWLGAGLGSLGLKIGQRTDVYKYFEQKKVTAQDRAKIDDVLEKLMEAAVVHYDFKQVVYQDPKYVELVSEMDQLLKDYTQEEDAEAKEILAEKIKQKQAEKKAIAQQYEQLPNQAENSAELKNLAMEYNKLIDNARSAAYYDLSADERKAIDANWDNLSEAERDLYTLPNSDKRTMKIRLGQILLGNLDANDNLKKRKAEDSQTILRDYVRGKVEATGLIKDGLNTAFTLTGAGVFRGLAYATMAMVERGKSKNREFRKEYSWNQIGEKISADRRLFDLFISTMKETYYGLSGRKFIQKYIIGPDGKLQRVSDRIKLRGLQATAIRAQSVGEIIRLFGIGSQTMAAVITDGMSLERSLEIIADTFKGNVFQNMANNWYQNFRIDQRIAKSFKALQNQSSQGASKETEEVTTAVQAAQEKPASSDNDINLKKLEELDTNKISWLAAKGRPVKAGSSVSETLGRSVSNQESMLLVSFNRQGEPIIYDGYDPNIIAPGAKVVDYGGRLVAIDTDATHLHFYDQHYWNDFLPKPIEIKRGPIDDQHLLDALLNKQPQTTGTTPDSTAINNVVAGSDSLGKYSDHPYFNLTTKGKIDYSDLVRGDNNVYHQFVTFNRPGGVFDNTTHSNQDLLSDIDRIYNNRDLSVGDRIKILESIKQEITDPNLVNQVSDPGTRELLAGTYHRYADVIDHQIALLQHPDGQPVPQEWRDGIEGFTRWRDSNQSQGSQSEDLVNYNVANSVDVAVNAQTILTNPKSSFTDIKTALLTILPEDHDKVKIGELNIVRHGDRFYINDHLLNKHSYHDLLFKPSELLNKAVTSPKSVEELHTTLSAENAFSNLDASIKAGNDFLNPAIPFVDKINGLKAVIPENSRMEFNDIIFLRANDQIYIKLTGDKVLPLSSPEVVERYLQDRKEALSQALNELEK